MAGSDVKLVSLGDYIIPIDRRNTGYILGVDSVRGVSNTKEIMPTKASVDEKVIDKFLLIYPNEFVYNPRTTRMGEKIGLVYNNTQEPLLFTFNNLAFAIKEECKSLLLPDYLYLFFNRAGFDRYSRVNSWGSATELFPFSEMQRVKIPLPSIEKQREIVAEWKGLREMKEQNEQIAQPLMELCQSLIEKCKKEYPTSPLGDFIEAKKQHCGDSNAIVSGVDINKDFIETRANLEGTDVKKYYQVLPNQFAANLMHIGRDERIPIAFNNTDKTLVVTSAYYIFQVKEKCKSVILSDYLSLYFHNPEIDRICWFFTDSSVRGNLQENRLFDIPIPLPPIAVQQAIVNIYKSAQEAKKIAEEADKLSNALCPALIQHVIHS